MKQLLLAIVFAVAFLLGLSAAGKSNATSLLQVVPVSPELGEPAVIDLLTEHPDGEELESSILFSQPDGPETMMLAANTGLSHTKVGIVSTESPLLSDFQAAIQASRKTQDQQKQSEKMRVGALSEKLACCEVGATLDFSTPGDDHCLFHALARGGLLKDIKEPLSVKQLRQIALSMATPEQIRIAALSTGDDGVAPEEYRKHMALSLWGDNLMISLLAKVFGDISVITSTGARTFTQSGGEQDGVLSSAVWVAHLGELHYYGFFALCVIIVNVLYRSG